MGDESNDRSQGVNWERALQSALDRLPQDYATVLSAWEVRTTNFTPNWRWHFNPCAQCKLYVSPIRHVGGKTRDCVLGQLS